MAFKANKVIALFFNECACHQLLSLVKCFNLLLLRHSARDFTNLKEHDMAVWFVSRHPGAIDWMAQQAHWQVDHWVAHLQLDDVQAGDVVVGTLPLGMRLYELPLERTEFEYAYLSPEHPANPCNETIVSRRSCFYLQAAPLLLIESYLPVLKHYDE